MKKDYSSIQLTENDLWNLGYEVREDVAESKNFQPEFLEKNYGFNRSLSKNISKCIALEENEQECPNDILRKLDMLQFYAPVIHKAQNKQYLIDVINGRRTLTYSAQSFFLRRAAKLFVFVVILGILWYLLVSTSNSFFFENELSRIGVAIILTVLTLILGTMLLKTRTLVQAHKELYEHSIHEKQDI